MTICTDRGSQGLVFRDCTAGGQHAFDHMHRSADLDSRLEWKTMADVVETYATTAPCSSSVLEKRKLSEDREILGSR